MDYLSQFPTQQSSISNFDLKKYLIPWLNEKQFHIIYVMWFNLLKLTLTSTNPVLKEKYINFDLI